METNSRFKKELGDWGEKILDNYMNKRNWGIMNKNLRIKKGEIDRIYISKENFSQEIKVCLAEIKTSLFYKMKDIETLYTEIGVKRYLKQRQIRNLFLYAENLNAQFYYKMKKKFKIYIRFFIVLKSKSNLNYEKIKLPKLTPAIKLCYKGENYLIFSIEPEFTRIQGRKSLLQIKI
jgi:Holliday junction resolvase-like predicted endonuclease